MAYQESCSGTFIVDDHTHLHKRSLQHPDIVLQYNGIFSIQGQDNMNTTEAGSNFTLSSSTENITLSSLTTTTISPTIPQPPSYFSDIHDPEITIMVVLGLSLLLAGFAAFLAVCRRSEQDGDSETSCSPGESLTRGRSRSSEPQLKVWKRLGSYRRSYNLSFRRPPPRRPQERENTHVSRSPAGQTPQAEASVEPHLTMPCLFDYVTEIWLEDRLRVDSLLPKMWYTVCFMVCTRRGLCICFKILRFLGGWGLVQNKILSSQFYTLVSGGGYDLIQQ